MMKISAHSLIVAGAALAFVFSSFAAPDNQNNVLSKSPKDTLNLLAPIWTPYRLITLSYAVFRCVSATEFENDESTPSGHCRRLTQAHSKECPQTFDRKA